MNNLVDSLVLSSMKTNFVRFIEIYGYDEADRKMASLFGDAYKWKQHELWQWFDHEYDRVPLKCLALPDLDIGEAIVCINKGLK